MALSFEYNTSCGLLRFALFYLLVQALAVAGFTLKPPKDDPDYLIVGGGPAGLVIAEELTRNPYVRVVLLEAGPDPSLDPAVTSMSPFHDPTHLSEVPSFLTTHSASQIFRRVPLLLELYFCT